MQSQVGSAEWGLESRGFWTKRRKTAGSLFTVLALIAGIAVAFKLFDRTVPNNVVRDAAIFDYTVEKMDEGIGDADFVAAGPAQPIFETNDQYPGDTREVDVRIINTHVNPAKDASFQVHIENIEIFGCVDGANNPFGVDSTGACTGGAFGSVPSSAAAYSRFLNFWTIAIDRQAVLQVDDEDVVQPTFQPACEAGLRELTKAAPCDLGRVRASGSDDASGAPTDSREYVFSLTEADDGSDQSMFKGWYVDFDFVFNARLPAVEDSAGLAGFR